MTRNVLQPAFVLHRRPYRETSLLLEVFTREHGRLGLVARGVRGAKRRSPTSLEPLQELMISWTLRGELGRLNQAEAAGPAPGLSGEALISALYLNELLLRLITRHDPHPQLFDHYRKVLRELGGSRVEAPLRLFEKDLLSELGYGLNLLYGVDGEPVRADLRYEYQAGVGARAVDKDCRAGLVVDGASLLALESGQLEKDENLRDAKRVLRAALAAQLGDRPLNTPALFRSLRHVEARRQTPQAGTHQEL